MEAQPLPRRILVGISMAEQAGAPDVHVTAADRHAAEQAAWLAGRIDAEVRLYHVAELLDDIEHVDAEALARTIRQHMGDELERLAEVGRRRGATVSWGIGRGRAWYELLREANEWGADLLVLSPHRGAQSWLERLVHGSTVRRLLRKSPLPVWLSHPASAVALRRVLALVDDSPTAAQVVATTAAIAQRTGAAPHLLHCLEYPMDFALHHLPDAAEAIARYHAEVRERAEHLVDELLGAQREGWTVLLEEGRPETVTARVVAASAIDLAVMASSSERGVATALLGTTAEAILAHAEVSMWVLRPSSWPAKTQFGGEAGPAPARGADEAQRAQTAPEWPAPP